MGLLEKNRPAVAINSLLPASQLQISPVNFLSLTYALTIYPKVFFPADDSERMILGLPEL
ncbi:hypothetical protein [Desulforamulus ruminis]|uniref:hypothetical protein n=1 Tax=Desulforamulus ruminis TaxID=1564 RepID=UPI0023531D7E|nr:hypothetical protein [Desulforamulus ruminis]